MKMFEVEKMIMKCWEINDDLELVLDGYKHDAELCDRVLGLKHVYEMRFNKLWSNYEDALQEFYNSQKRVEGESK